MSETTEYVPGICNINKDEIRKRRLSGYFSLAIVAFGLSAFIAMQANWPYFLVLFIPTFVSSLGFLQAKQKFCATYGAIGKQHTDDDDIEVVEDESARKADKVRARIIYLQSFLIATVLTAISCFIPLFY